MQGNQSNQIRGGAVLGGIGMQTAQPSNYVTEAPPTALDIPVAIDQVHAAIADAEQSLNTLLARLEKVTRITPEAEVGRDFPGGNCKLSSDIYTAVGRVQLITERLNAQLRNLEL